MPRIRFASLTLAALSAVALPLAAQTATTAPAAAPAPSAPATVTPLNFSGVLFGNYGYQLPTTPAGLSNQNNNSFILDRAYLTFKMPAGDHVSVRVTTDIFQDAGANAYTVRAKYAYLEYTAPKMASGAQVLGRLGILQNVVIDHEENFWPRYVSQTPVDKYGWMPSADAGIATGIALPNKIGEVYATVTNGTGYAARENNRFKDYALRLSLTPLANAGSQNALLNTFTITAWGYKGANASKWADRTVAAGTDGEVGSALDRSRAGVFVGLRDPRLSLGGEFDQRHDEGETGGNIAATNPRVVNSITGRILSGFVVARPLAFMNSTGKSPFGVLARYDRVTPTSSTTGLTTSPDPSNAYHTAIAGLFWDLSQKAQVALDYQESLASNNGLSSAPPSQTKGYYAHFVVNF